jgi:hypothetical protein
MHASLPVSPLRGLLFLLGLFAAGAGVWAPSPAGAAVGDQMQLEGHDLQLFVDYRWAGTMHGGYYPIRIQILNKGPDCLLTLRFKPFREQQLPSVERKDLPVGSERRATITLSVPMVGRGGIGDLEVERDGEVLDQLTRRISLSYADYRSVRSSVLVVSPSLVQVLVLEQGMQYHQSRPEIRTALDQLVIEPIMLPSAWSDYTGLDFVMIPMATLADLPSEKRSAILHWVQTGGTLVIYEVNEPAATSAELQSLVNLPEPRQWTKANPGQRPDDVPQQLQQLDRLAEPPMELFEEQSRWPVSEETFVYSNYLLGRIYAFRFNPFPGTPADWAWWAMTVPTELSSWESRQGVLPRRSNENFFNFLIPGVTSVPVYAFLVLMTLFTIVIGPLNYIFLRRRKRTYLLLLTIPVIAFVTSLTLFLYSTLAYGFSVSSRSRSLTVLDQRINTAVSLSRVSLFAGMAPSGGLKFSPDTAVFPMWAPLQFGQSQFESGRVVWGEKQELADGWLRSRTRTQFTTVQHRTERGRLEIEAASEGKLTISNGLEWDIEAILWLDEAGNFYQGASLGAGNTGELVRVSPGQFSVELKPFQAMLEQNEKLEFPDDIDEGKQRVELGLMETRIQQFLKIKDYQNQDTSIPWAPQILTPRSYLAVLAERPGIELGLEDTDERAGYHLLLGYY